MFAFRSKLYTIALCHISLNKVQDESSTVKMPVSLKYSC